MEKNKIQNCEFCQEVFGSLDDLVNHLVYDHANNLSEEMVSSKQIEPSKELQNNVQQVQGNKDHKCAFCGKSFTRSRSTHIKSEEEKRREVEAQLDGLEIGSEATPEEILTDTSEALDTQSQLADTKSGEVVVETKEDVSSETVTAEEPSSEKNV